MSIDTPSTDEVQTVLDDLGADVDLEQEGVDIGFEIIEHGLNFVG